jgi:hypothetical protein
MAGDRDRLTFRIVWACPVVAGLAPVTTALGGMPITVSAADTFSHDVSYTYALSASTRARVHAQISGRVNGDDTITGVFHPELMLGGARGASCDPGAIAFSAAGS